LVVAFVFVDRRVVAAVLPRSTFQPGPLKWIYLTLGVLMAATMVDMYVPLFGQRLGALTPVMAGFLGAALSVGWTVGEITSASLHSVRLIRRVVAVAERLREFSSRRFQRAASSPNWLCWPCQWVSSTPS